MRKKNPSTVAKLLSVGNYPPLPIPAPPSLLPPAVPSDAPAMDMPAGGAAPMPPEMQQDGGLDMSQFELPQQGNGTFPGEGDMPPPGMIPGGNPAYGGGPAANPSPMGGYSGGTRLPIPPPPQPITAPPGNGQTMDDATRAALLMPALSMLLGGSADYARRTSPGILTSAIAGQSAREQQEAQRQAQVGAMNNAAMKDWYEAAPRFAETNINGQKADILGQEADTKSFTASSDYTMAMRKYRLDEGKFFEEQRTHAREDDVARAGVAAKYTELMAGMTPESQVRFFMSLDPRFKSYYGISLPDGGVEKANPNQPTRAMFLNQELDRLHKQLASHPELLTGVGQKKILMQIAQVQNELGLPDNDPQIVQMFDNITPDQRAKIRAEAARIAIEDRRQKETARANRANEALREQEIEVRRQEARTRAWITSMEARNNPSKAYDAATNQLRYLTDMKDRLTTVKNTMTGAVAPLSDADIEAYGRKASVKWINEQIAFYQKQQATFAPLVQQQGATTQGNVPFPQGSVTVSGGGSTTTTAPPPINPSSGVMPGTSGLYQPGATAPPPAVPMNPAAKPAPTPEESPSYGQVYRNGKPVDLTTLSKEELGKLYIGKFSGKGKK